MSLATTLLNTVASTIKKFGALATYNHVSKGTYNTTTSTTSPNTVTPQSVYITVDATSLVSLGFTFGKDLVRSGAISVVVPAKGLSPKPVVGDQLTFDGSTYAVAAVRPQFVGAMAVLYELLLTL